MKLLTLPETTFDTLDLRFKQSPLSQFIASFISMGLILSAWAWAIWGDLHWGVVLFLSLFFGLITCVSLSSYVKSLAATNWILIVGPNQILVKFRSYLNPHFPITDPQVAQFHPSEISWARITKQRVTSPGSDNSNSTSFHTFLDLSIKDADLVPLKERITYERTLRLPPQGKWIKSSGKSHHYPVSVVDNTMIRIEWRSPQDIVTPSIKKAIRALENQGLRIEPLQKEVIDLIGDKKDKQRMEDKILHLAERGNILAATKLARRTYKMNITEAKAFVEDLLK